MEALTDREKDIVRNALNVAVDHWKARAKAERFGGDEHFDTYYTNLSNEYAQLWEKLRHAHTMKVS